MLLLAAAPPRLLLRLGGLLGPGAVQGLLAEPGLLGDALEFELELGDLGAQVGLRRGAGVGGHGAAPDNWGLPQRGRTSGRLARRAA